MNELTICKTYIKKTLENSLPKHDPLKIHKVDFIKIKNFCSSKGIDKRMKI